jgi:hypothetical protein
MTEKKRKFDRMLSNIKPIKIGINQSKYIDKHLYSRELVVSFVIVLILLAILIAVVVSTKVIIHVDDGIIVGFS